MTYAFKVDGAWVEVDRERHIPIPDGEGREARISPAFAESLSPDARADLGLVQVVEPAAPGVSSRITGHTIDEVDGVPHRVWVIEAVPLAELKASLIDAVRAKRAAVEAGGIIRNGAPLSTDERTQNRINGALRLFDEAPQLEEVDWEVAPGAFATMDRATVKAIGVEIGLHIQACFSRSRELVTAINGATDVPGILAIDIGVGWPT